MRQAPRIVLMGLCVTLLAGAGRNTIAQDGDDSAMGHWNDFMHYILIAKPDLALGNGQYLLDSVSKAELLDAVEGSRFAETHPQVLVRAQGMETLRDVATKVGRKIQESRMERSREPDRINQDIQKLAQGERPRKMALERLRAAGQFAVPYLLATLQNQEEARLHAYAAAALVTLGQDSVYPLSIALAQLEPVQQGVVAEILGQIGYPTALPYLKRVMEDPNADPHAKSIITRTFNDIARRRALTDEISAGELFLILGEGYYTAATDPNRLLAGMDDLDQTGVVWYYNPEAGAVSPPLFFRKVPKRVYGDVLAHRAARNALKLAPDMDQALSLWLMANLRRENRLGADEDPTYPPTWQPPLYYAYAANPLRSHDVLARALNDGDSDLARDAIEALSHNAGTQIMVNAEGLIQPILRALSYPDRRVRYESAFALTNNHPTAEFPGSYRVVPVLSEAVRQTSVRYALVLGTTETRVNNLMNALREAGYEAFGGTSLETATAELRIKPGVDMIVTDYTTDAAKKLIADSVQDYKLAAVPIVVAGGTGTVIDLRRDMPDNPRIVVTEVSPDDPASMKGAIDLARESYAGKEIEADEAASYASTALTLLREIAVTRAKVYNVLDSEGSVIQALKDDRQEIVKQAGHVLAALDSDSAQQALIKAGLDDALPEDSRVSLLTSLAESARQYGVRVTNIQLNGLHQLVGTGTGDLALAAARAYGALTQPTDKIVEMIRE